MLTHPSGLFERLHFGPYWMLHLKYLHALQSPKLYFQSDYGSLLGPGGLMLGSAPYFWLLEYIIR